MSALWQTVMKMIAAVLMIVGVGVGVVAPSIEVWTARSTLCVVLVGISCGLQGYLAGVLVNGRKT